MIFTPVIWSLDHSGTCFCSVSCFQCWLIGRERPRSTHNENAFYVARLFCCRLNWSYPRCLTRFWRPERFAAWRWRNTLNHPLCVVKGAKAKETRISLAQVKAGYKADVSESSRQVTTSSTTRLFRRFQGSESSDTISVPVNQSLIQPMSQHHSWSQSFTVQHSGVRNPPAPCHRSCIKQCKWFESFW